jgi:hypothetical protein
MRKIIAIFILILSYDVALCQDSPTITAFNVDYKTLNVTTDDTINIQAFPKATITFGSLNNVEKVRLKILSLENQSLIYNVRYDLNSSNIISGSNLVLYSKTGNTILINCPDLVTLMTYKYEVETEDSEGNLTLTFSDIK